MEIQDNNGDEQPDNYNLQNIQNIIGVDKGIGVWKDLPLADVTRPKAKAPKRWLGLDTDKVTTKYLTRVIQKDNKSLKLMPNIIDNNRLSLADNFKSLVGKKIIHFPAWPGEISTNELYIRSAIFESTEKTWSRSCFDIVKIEYTFEFREAVDNSYTTSRYTAVDDKGKFVNFFKSSTQVDGDATSIIEFGDYKAIGLKNSATGQYDSIRLEKDTRQITVSQISFDKRFLNDQTGIVKLTKFNSKIEKGVWDYISNLNYIAVSATIHIEYKVENVINDFPEDFPNAFSITRIQISNLTHFFTFINYVPNVDVNLKEAAKKWFILGSDVQVRINASLGIINSYWNSCKTFVKQLCRVSLGGSKFSKTSYDTALAVIASFIKASMKFIHKWNKVSTYEPKTKWEKSEIELALVTTMYEYHIKMEAIAKPLTNVQSFSSIPNDYKAHIDLVTGLLPRFQGIGIDYTIVPELLDHAKVQFASYNAFFTQLSAWVAVELTARNTTVETLKETRKAAMKTITTKLTATLKLIGESSQYLTQKMVANALDEVAVAANISEEERQKIVKQALMKVVEDGELIVPEYTNNQELLDYINLSIKRNREDGRSMFTQSTNVNTNIGVKEAKFGGGGSAGYQGAFTVGTRQSDIPLKEQVGEEDEADVNMNIVENTVLQQWIPLDDIDSEFSTDDIKGIKGMIDSWKNKSGNTISKTAKVVSKMIAILRKVYDNGTFDDSINKGITYPMFKFMIMKLKDLRNTRLPEREDVDFVFNFVEEVNRLYDLYFPKKK